MHNTKKLCLGLAFGAASVVVLAGTGAMQGITRTFRVFISGTPTSHQALDFGGEIYVPLKAIQDAGLGGATSGNSLFLGSKLPPIKPISPIIRRESLAGTSILGKAGGIASSPRLAPIGSAPARLLLPAINPNGNTPLVFGQELQWPHFNIRTKMVSAPGARPVIIQFDAYNKWNGSTRFYQMLDDPPKLVFKTGHGYFGKFTRYYNGFTWIDRPSGDVLLEKEKWTSVQMEFMPGLSSPPTDRPAELHASFRWLSTPPQPGEPIVYGPVYLKGM